MISELLHCWPVLLFVTHVMRKKHHRGRAIKRIVIHLTTVEWSKRIMIRNYSKVCETYWWNPPGTCVLQLCSTKKNLLGSSSSLPEPVGNTLLFGICTLKLNFKHDKTRIKIGYVLNRSSEINESKSIKGLLQHSLNCFLYQDCQ